MGPTVSRAFAFAFASCAALFVTGCMVTATPGPTYPSNGLEWNVDRPGSDYRSFDLPSPSPEMCQSTCMNEPTCVAFTYVNPGVQGPNPRCWLKNAVPAPVPQSCCVSGTKYGGATPPPSPSEPPPPAAAPPPPPPPPPSSGWQGTPPPAPAPAPPPPSSEWRGTPPPPPPASGWRGTPTTPVPARQWEPNTDRPGSDYRSFDLREPRPELCRDACWGEAQCRAFTYVRPGVQGPHARCWLKNVVPPARPNDCCLSGMK